MKKLTLLFLILLSNYLYSQEKKLKSLEIYYIENSTTDTIKYLVTREIYDENENIKEIYQFIEKNKLWFSRYFFRNQYNNVVRDSTNYYSDDKNEIIIKQYKYNNKNELAIIQSSNTDKEIFKRINNRNSIRKLKIIFQNNIIILI